VNKMKKKITFMICMFMSAMNVSAQTIITMPTTGTQTVSTCGGTLYDSGGPSGNYSNNENGVLAICPAVAGYYVSLNFSVLASEASTDYLSIYNGSSVTSPIMAPTPISGNLSCSSTFTSSDSSGCLTIRFVSNGNNTQAGWKANFGCSFTTTPTTVLGGDCSLPVFIPSIPFTDSMQCTNCMPNSFQTQSGICNTSYAGQNRIYRYNAPGPECDSIIMSNTSVNIPALAIYRECPGSAGSICLTTTPMVGNNSMQFTFPGVGNYYIIIDAVSGYTCYDLSIIPCTIGINEAESSHENIFVFHDALTEQITIRLNNSFKSTVAILDCRGRLICSAAGNERVIFSTINWDEGIYFVRSISDKAAVTKKMFVAK
jgi:hypothetical protein